MVPLRILLAGLATLALGGCGGGGGTAPAALPASAPASPAAPPAPAAARAVPQDDLAIAALVYADGARVPPGFAVEPPRYDAAYATIAHLRNTDLDAAAGAPRELCAASFAAAFDASEAAIRAQPVYGDLVENATTTRYHEFVRRLRSTPARHAIHRVWRCDYLDRAGADPAAPTGPAGRLTRADFTSDDVRGLGEYLWNFSADNNAGRAVLTSDGSAGAGAHAHRMHVARLVRATPPSTCDRVEVWRLELSASRADGALERTATLAFAFGARRADGVTSLCG